jgi:hypothetical protein
MSSLSFPLPPLPPTRYFDLLPTSLVSGICQVIDSLPRKERQATLLSLCLTSKILRSHAQPLLLKRVYTSVGAGSDLLKLLVEKSYPGSLVSVQEFIFDTPDLKGVSKSLKMFVLKATTLQEVYISKQVVALKAFFGSSKHFSSLHVTRSSRRFSLFLFTDITTLSLRHVTMTLGGATFSFPELLRLSMVVCPIRNEGGIRFSLSKLKHLAFISATSQLSPQEIAFLDQLVPRIVSFTVSLDKINTLPASILNHPTLPILYATSSVMSEVRSLQGVRHLLTPIRGQVSQGLADLIENSVHQLETVILAWYGEGNRPEELVGPLLAACKDRAVEVLWEHRPEASTFVGTNETFFHVVPSSFIKRVEGKQGSRTVRIAEEDRWEGGQRMKEKQNC